MKRHYLIDHRILFLFGYIFYLFTPLMVGRGDFFEGLPGISLYQRYYDAIPDQNIRTYFWISIAWLPAFYLGHIFFTLVRPYKTSLGVFPATPVSYATTYVGSLLLIVLVLFAYLGRASLLQGYSSYDVASRGKLSSLLVIFNFFLLYQLLSRQRLSIGLAAGTVATALILLSMGGRMYVFQTFIILLVYKTSFAPKRWSILHISLLIISALVIATAAGIWRMGDSLNLRKAAYSILAEPVFTWFSTSSFLSSNTIPLIHFPANFLTSFLNMIPNTILNLQRFVISTKEMGFTYDNPLGAESAWTTFIINFGVIGTFIFLFVTGFLINMLRAWSETSRMGATYYILVCSILPFQFFRDGFYILNKQLVFNFCLFPACILLFLQLINFSQIILNKGSLDRIK
ncbi:MAG: oligosaccharide repeat unit polymerase [Chitinophagaceae bacterium]|nr:oligosaccharide repeat unit polymerase [Chitinophagaceae bacterium]